MKITNPNIKVRITDPKLLKALNQKAEQEGETASLIIRNALRIYLFNGKQK